MPNILFVAPFAMETTLRFVRAVADLDGVRLGIISQEPAERLPESLRARLAAHWRVDDALDPGQLHGAAAALARQLGPIHRLLGVLEQAQVPIAEARRRLGVEGMGPEAAENFRDKARMKTVLRAAGLPCARHRLVASAEEAFRFAAEVAFPIVVKPPAGAGARSTYRVDDQRAFQEALELARPSGERPVLLEEFIVGREHSFDSLFIDGRPVWHSISHYFPTPLEVLQNPWIQWCVLVPCEVDHPPYEDIVRTAVHANRVLGLDTGMSHMEWFRRGDGGLAISEVGARPPGAQFTTLISYANDTDFYGAWARVVVFKQFEPPRRRFAAGAAYLRGQGKGRVVAIHGLDEVQREVGGLAVEVKLPQAGQAPSGSYEGEGYVIVRHPETAVVEKALERIVSLVRVELG